MFDIALNMLQCNITKGDNMIEFLRLIINSWNTTANTIKFDNTDEDIKRFFKSEYKNNAQYAYEYWRSTNSINFIN